MFLCTSEPSLKQAKTYIFYLGKKDNFLIVAVLGCQ